MGKKTIGWYGYNDFSIYDNDVKIGTLRVRANGILWAARGKQSWLKVPIEDFAEFAEKLDIKVKK